HVMEHECFENQEVAEMMNKYFINIKVDREERPDVDHIYMTAVQLMSGHGGWPLNCFALPDGKPVYGGTYFPKQQWMNLLQKLNELYTHNREQVEQYGKELTAGIKHTDELVHVSAGEKTDHKNSLEKAVAHWQKRFDRKEGGNA